MTCPIRGCSIDVMVVLILYILLLGLGCTLAFARGGNSEQAVAAVTLLGSLASIFVASAVPRRWHGSEPGLLILDVAILIAFAAIMLASTRYWPIWTTAAQFLTVGAHLGPSIRPTHIAIPFAFDEQVWSWFILVQLIIVSAGRIRRRRT